MIQTDIVITPLGEHKEEGRECVGKTGGLTLCTNIQKGE